MEDLIAGKGPVSVLVVVPGKLKRPAVDELVAEVLKRMKVEAKKLVDFVRLSVSEGEFQLDLLSRTKASGNPIVMIPGLHEFWTEYGEFPRQYYVWTEEVVNWGLVKNLLALEKDRVVLVGSPGVGKSCFLVLVAFYLACIEKKKVLVICHWKGMTKERAVVFFDGQGSYKRLGDLKPSDLLAVREEAGADALVLVDGYNQNELSRSNGLLPFRVLATSCQYDAKHDDSAQVVVLPAWRRDDMLEYAKRTDWTTETKLRNSKVLRASTIPKLVREQYFYSGGSLREFCKIREDLIKRANRDCSSVVKDGAVELVYNYGSGKAKDQVDRLRRHYVTHPTDEAHYSDIESWTLMVDSGYALSRLGPKVGMDKQLEVYKCAKLIDAGFQGVAYELLFHNANAEACAKDVPVVLKMRAGSTYEKIEIKVPVRSYGGDEKTC